MKLRDRKKILDYFNLKTMNLCFTLKTTRIFLFVIYEKENETCMYVLYIVSNPFPYLIHVIKKRLSNSSMIRKDLSFIIEI